MLMVDRRAHNGQQGITAFLVYGATMLEHFLLATVPMRYGCMGQMAAVPVAIVIGWWWGEPLNRIKMCGCAVVLGGMVSPKIHLFLFLRNTLS